MQPPPPQSGVLLTAHSLTLFFPLKATFTQDPVVKETGGFFCLLYGDPVNTDTEIPLKLVNPQFPLR